MNFVVEFLALILGASPYPVWQQVYDGGKVDMCHGLCLDSSGRVVVVGETNQASNYDCWMIAISKSGDSLWSWFYDDGSDEKGSAITTTREGSIAVFTTIDLRVKTMLYDSSGSILWQHGRTAPTHIEIAGIIATGDDRIYTADWYRYSNYEYLNMACYSCGGDLIFYTNTLTVWSGVTDITVGPLGYIYLGSSKAGPCALWRFSSEGEIEWFREYGNGTTRGFALEINDADHFFLSGDFVAGTHFDFDFLLLKWDTAGRLIWPEHKAYDLGADEHCRDIALDAGPAGPSDCYLAGWQERGEEEDVALIKTDSAGNMLWGWVDTLEGKQQIESIEVDSDGYIYLAGSHHNGENWDMLVMKVRQPLTITGRVTDSADASMEGITVSLTGDTTVDVLTDTGGYYFIEVYNGGNYTVSPNLHSWVFEPSSHTYTPLAHRMWDQDFENGRWTGVGEDTYIRPSPYWELISSVGPQIVLQYFNYPQGFNVSIFDASGCRVEEIHSATQSGTLIWGENQHPGVYFVQVRSGESIENMKVVLVK